MPAPSTHPPGVILLSGGLDSAVTLAVARRDGFTPHALSFDYGQRHRHELDAARRVAESLGAASHRTLSVDLRAVGASALTADLDVPKDRDPSAPGIPITYVPARNLIFLSLATALAEAVGASDLFIGVNAIDYSGYPDCRPEFIKAFQRAATLGTRAGTDDARPLRIHTPLIDFSKATIIRLGASLGVDFSLTHSCYDPDARARACARCDSCQLRRRGFEEAGIPDPTVYAHQPVPS
ncbi:MAG: 7-cyano-7-deazaguanine synthase QueC [Phycisphaerales bacterium]